MPQGPLIPWTTIAKLAALSVAPGALLLWVGLPHVVAAIGFLVGFTASIFAARTWALAAVAAALGAYAIFLLIPAGGLYILGAGLVGLGFLVAPRGGGKAMAFATLGWVYLALVYPVGAAPVVWLVFLGGGLWGVLAADWTGLAGLAAPKSGERRAAHPLIAVLICAGVVLALWLATHLPLTRPYWLPFVYLQVLGTAGVDNARVALRRVVGAAVGVAFVIGVTWMGPPHWLEFTLAAVFFVLALRGVMAYPILARAGTTAGILLMLAAVDQDGTQSRLIAEVAGVALLLAVSAGIAVLVGRAEAAEEEH